MLECEIFRNGKLQIKYLVQGLQLCHFHQIHKKYFGSKFGMKSKHPYAITFILCSFIGNKHPVCLLKLSTLESFVEGCKHLFENPL